MSNRKITSNGGRSEQTNSKTLARAEKPAIPAPPEKPSAHECCGSGCVPCIYDYYYDALDKWQLEYGSDK